MFRVCTGISSTLFFFYFLLIIYLTGVKGDHAPKGIIQTVPGGLAYNGEILFFLPWSLQYFYLGFYQLLIKTYIVYPRLTTNKGVKQLTQYHDLSIWVAFDVLGKIESMRLAAETQSLQRLFPQSCLRLIQLSILVSLFGEWLPLAPLFGAWFSLKVVQCILAGKDSSLNHKK